MDDNDFQRLVADQPVLQLSEATRQRHLQRLSELSAPVPSGSYWSSPARRTAIVAASVAALGLGGAAAAVGFGVFTQVPENRDYAHCYASTDLDSETNHFEFVVALPPDASADVGDAAVNALDVCASSWRSGMLRTAPPRVVRDYAEEGGEFAAPNLIPCVLESGEVAVFPGNQLTCARIGLAEADIHR